ncbi:MAG TPA: hypothetical protein VMV25_07350 [Steroidobacteraceae bacterium]|nr:hypothetical protein [Steroidobacteraceae bacterium]
MPSNDAARSRGEAKFSFGVRELERADGAHGQASQDTQDTQDTHETQGAQETIASAEPTGGEAPASPAAGDTQGFDPYNSTDSFEIKQAWARIRKR